jgi:hypothetical protein
MERFFEFLKGNSELERKGGTWKSWRTGPFSCSSSCSAAPHSFFQELLSLMKSNFAGTRAQRSANWWVSSAFSVSTMTLSN